MSDSAPVPIVLRKGELVRATCQGRTVKAMVTIASPNGRSLVIEWTKTDDGMLTGHPGVMPILWHPSTNTFRALLDGASVTLERV